ncbi:Integrase core domain protein [Roseibium album]|uniref:Integrase core domain protein n=1 Tax=Roseibium album TaxID=311410 RepID=A0A0M6ZMB7_9HYPH|nr:Integrase core domain protein [Roseibium album]CTQ69043.1 Integrase core domain protein [Roseibium album]CTQ80787.1 Integrase core domain protein [Roseibium album]
MRSDWSVSIRRPCAVIRLDPTTYRYKSRRSGQAALEQRIREICQTRVRFRYRRVYVLLRRVGWIINQKKTRRIYNELGLQLRNKHPKRRVKAKLREDRQEAVEPNDVWAMDFVHDQLATGRKIRVLTVIDKYSRYVPALDPRFSYRGEDVVRTLEIVCKQIGYPKTIRAPSSSPGISICGPIEETSRLTSPGLENRRTTHSSRPSTDGSGPSA